RTRLRGSTAGALEPATAHHIIGKCQRRRFTLHHPFVDREIILRHPDVGESLFKALPAVSAIESLHITDCLYCLFIVGNDKASKAILDDFRNRTPRVRNHRSAT